MRRGIGPGSRRRDEAVFEQYERISTTKSPARGRKQRPRDFNHGLLVLQYAQLVAMGNWSAVAIFISQFANQLRIISLTDGTLVSRIRKSGLGQNSGRSREPTGKEELLNQLPASRFPSDRLQTTIRDLLAAIVGATEQAISNWR